jgi:hypothetical protein
MTTHATQIGEPLRISRRDLLPARVRSGELKLAKYEICTFGLASDTVGDVIIDRRIALIQPHPESSLYLCPLSPHAQPTQTEAWFYCDCIAYEHDIPAMVLPTARELSQFKHRYLHSGPTKPRTETIVHVGDEEANETITRRPLPPQVVTRTFLLQQLTSILAETRELRHGPLTYVLFRTYRHKRRTHLPYSATYRSVAKELCLFSTALRQADFLAEFLGYYRVIESATQSNGKKWIAAALQRLPAHKWPRIALGHEEDFGARPRNVIGWYRRRAAQRLRELRRRLGGDEEVARYLYNVNRCGIAHGRGDVVRGEITAEYFDVARDAVILKLLARMAIDEIAWRMPNNGVQDTLASSRS